VQPDFEIGGIKFTNILKVKSKGRAIMNLKENGSKLEGYDEEFLKVLLSNHEKHADKMKDFDHFSVDTHPDYPNTRCFFVVRKDGSKEDFSMSRCV